MKTIIVLLAFGLSTQGQVPKKEVKPINVEKKIANKTEYIGNFRITYYWLGEDNYGYETASGERSRHLQTVAVDPRVIPLGTTIIINGEEYKAIDTGGAVKGNVIDIFTEYPIHKIYRADVFEER